MFPPGHPPSSRSLARAGGTAGSPPGGARPGARKPLIYGARKQPHVRFPLPGNVSEAQRRTIRKLAEALGVYCAELVEDQGVKLRVSFTHNLDYGVKHGTSKLTFRLVTWKVE
jgi:hypothetical protein